MHFDQTRRVGLGLGEGELLAGPPVLDLEVNRRVGARQQEKQRVSWPVGSNHYVGAGSVAIQLDASARYFSEGIRESYEVLIPKPIFDSVDILCGRFEWEGPEHSCSRMALAARVEILSEYDRGQSR